MKKILWLFVAIGLLAMLALTSYQHKQNLQAVQSTLGIDLHADFLFLHNYIDASESTGWENTYLLERCVFSIVNKIPTVKNLYEQSTYNMDEEAAMLHDLYFNIEYVAEAFKDNEVDTDRLLEVKELLEQVGMTHDVTEQLGYDKAVEQLTTLNKLLKEQ